jgi:hypothetical protein
MTPHGNPGWCARTRPKSSEAVTCVIPKFRNGPLRYALDPMASARNLAKPLARAINIYSVLARHGVDPRTRRDLARHIRKLAAQGLDDQNRLTVHALSYLRSRERVLREKDNTNSSEE